LVTEENLMRGGRPSRREAEIIHSLLVQKGITSYQLFEMVEEGNLYPGSTYPDEIESISGRVITPTAIYDFWFDWDDEHFSLGEEEGYWEELPLEDLGQDRDKILQIQQQLRAEEERHGSS
jgi:hypothetical protein